MIALFAGDPQEPSQRPSTPVQVGRFFPFKSKSVMIPPGQPFSGKWIHHCES